MAAAASPVRRPDAGRGRAPGARLATAALSLGLPGLGQLARGRVVDGLLLLCGALLPYFFFLVLLNLRFGIPGELLTFAPFDGVHPIRPPAEHLALLLLGLTIHAAAVWDAARRS